VPRRPSPELPFRSPRISPRQMGEPSLQASGISEAGLQSALAQLWDEVMGLRVAQSGALSEHTKLFKQDVADKVESLRREAERNVAAERTSRLWEAAELRSTVRTLQQRVADCQNHLAATAMSLTQAVHPPELPGRRGEAREPSLAPQGCVNSLEELAKQLETECEGRCAKDAELHLRLGREISDLSARLEEHRIITAGEVAEAM